MPDETKIRRRLEAVDQTHLLRFYDELDADARRRLLERIDGLDLERLPELVDRYVRRTPEFKPPSELQPAPYYPADPEDDRKPWDRGHYRARGEDLVRGGKVAAFTVAGGQGTRLGFDGPKGMYPAAAVTGKTLFQILAEQIRAAQAKYDAVIPWYVMTSPLNHDETVAFFEERHFFDLDRENVFHFQQGVMPSLEAGTGRVLLAEKDWPATNPDGHGGSLLALYKSGALDDMRRRGVEHVSYVQIDNPLVKVIDPVFLGLHAEAPDSSAEMSSKMIPKTDPGEKVGVFCKADGTVRIIEYSDVPEELAQQRDERGDLRFNAGSPAIHILGVDFVRGLNEREGGFALPFHRADKKVPHIDLETGERVDPDEPNAVKLEMFVFDAIPLCEQPLILETSRVEEFAPVKNAEGADSPATSARLQTRRAANWLEQVGMDVPRDNDGEPDCELEISPLTALEPGDLKRADLPGEVEREARLVI